MKRPPGKHRPLAEYRRKRDFTKTKEPAGAAVRARSKRALRFVVHKHAASSLHFDFRLELDGVMKSWAVPKGPSYNPRDRRLAMEVEDHPIEYNTFEGTIPEGEYGGGTVMLWDRGTYEPEDGGGTEAIREGYERGDLKILLHGKRLQGGWVLVRMRRDTGARNQWLLIKHRDEFASATFNVVSTVVTSVKSDRTMDEIATRRGLVWRNNHAVTAPAKGAVTKRRSSAAKKPVTKPRASAGRRSTTKRRKSTSRGTRS